MSGTRRIEFVLSEEGARPPFRKYDGDAGWDLYSLEGVYVPGQSFVDVPTGVRVSLPPGMWMHMVGRSSSIRNHKLIVVPAVIDNGYTGELFFGVWNPSMYGVPIEEGTRLAQLIPHELANVEWVEVDNIAEKDRGSNGFGSTGK